MTQRAPAPAAVEAATVDTFRALQCQRATLAALDADVLHAQIEVSSIPAPTGDEGARARWMAARFRDLALDPRPDDAGNVIARVGSAASTAPAVVCAHLDTVFPLDMPLDVRRDGRRLVGPGVGDNARGLVAMLAIARVVRHLGPDFSRAVEFVATTGEEGAGDLHGARH